MYKRLDIEELNNRRNEYHKIPAFIVTYRAISWMSSTYNDIHPVEAWAEAVDAMKIFANEANKRFAIESFCYELFDKYEKFMELDGHIQSRTKEESERTALLVLFNVLFMLIMRQKELDGHPYKKYCEWIVRILNNSPLYKEMCNMTRTNEINLEEEIGDELAPQDFMTPDGMPRPVGVENDLTQQNKERAIELIGRCESYFKRGITIEYVETLWDDLLNEEYLHVDELLNGQSFDTLVFGVLGLIKDEICEPCTNISLARTIATHKKKQETIANYIGKKCSSPALKKVATFIKNRYSKSSRKSSSFK